MTKVTTSLWASLPIPALICDEGESCGAFRTIDSPVVLDLDRDLDSIEFSSDYLITLPVDLNATSLSPSTEKSLIKRR